jgi:thiosulfate/3-mercaptopyruvate sulfurtransferase
LGYGYKDVRLINGGRKKWLIEDRWITTEIPQYPKGNFIAEAETDDNIRAFLRYVRGTLENEPGGRTIELVDFSFPKNLVGKF